MKKQLAEVIGYTGSLFMLIGIIVVGTLTIRMQDALQGILIFSICTSILILIFRISWVPHDNIKNKEALKT